MAKDLLHGKVLEHQQKSKINKFFILMPAVAFLNVQVRYGRVLFFLSLALLMKTIHSEASCETEATRLEFCCQRSKL